MRLEAMWIGLGVAALLFGLVALLVGSLMLSPALGVVVGFLIVAGSIALSVEHENDLDEKP